MEARAKKQRASMIEALALFLLLSLPRSLRSLFLFSLFEIETGHVSLIEIENDKEER